MINYNPNSKRFLTISQVMTNDGTKNVKIILDVDTNIFYTLDDDNNLLEIGSHLQIITGFSINNIITLVKNNGEEIKIIESGDTTNTPIKPKPINFIKPISHQTNFVNDKPMWNSKGKMIKPRIKIIKPRFDVGSKLKNHNWI